MHLATLNTQEVGTSMLYQSSTCANLIILSEKFIHKKSEINNVNHSVNKEFVNQCYCGSLVLSANGIGNGTENRLSTEIKLLPVGSLTAWQAISTIDILGLRQ